MSQTTSLEQRIRILELHDAGFKDPEIALQLNLSKSTVRKWRRRLVRDRNSGLGLKLGRPRSGYLSTFSETLKAEVHQMRKRHEGWGPKTLRAELKRLGYPESQLPSEATLKRYLRQEALSRPYEIHTELPEAETSEVSYCHEEWEMDAKGHHYIPDVGVNALINLNDRQSHARLLSYPCYLGEKRAMRYPQTPDYQLTLRLAFSIWGMPARIGVDHDSVFYDNDHPSPFPTRFHLWLIGLGIDLCFGRKGFATDQAMTERSHQLWEQQVLKGQTFRNWDCLYLALQQRNEFLNVHLPCATFGGKTIVEANPQVKQPRRIYSVQYEENIFDLNNIYNYLAKGRWIRKVSSVGQVVIGGKHYGVGKAWARQQIEITFDLDRKQFVFNNHNEAQQQFHNLKSCSKEELMGELLPNMKVPGFQLCLPLSYDDWRKTKILQD